MPKYEESDVDLKIGDRVVVISEDSVFRGAVGTVNTVAQFAVDESIFVGFPGTTDRFRFRRDELAIVDKH